MKLKDNNVLFTVLITGVGAPPGVSIFKAFRQSPLNIKILATDSDPLSVGLFRADVAFQLPKITLGIENYIKVLKKICLQEKVQLVCFGSEIEMRKMSEHKSEFEAETGSKLVLNDSQYINSFMDKWNLVKILKSKNLPVPDSILATDSEGLANFLDNHPFPVVLKPREGSGSKNFYIINNREELNFFSKYIPEAVVQEYLLPDDEEYTVGVYKSPRTGYYGQIIFKRQLAAGLTYKAEVVKDQEIEFICKNLAESFDIWGPINVQLRKTHKGVKIFEVNLRFSSTAVMRAVFNFNEAEMCVRDLILKESLPPLEIKNGYSLRYWDEVYIEAHEYRNILEKGALRNPSSLKSDNF